jgi:hypothetical protein
VSERAHGRGRRIALIVAPVVWAAFAVWALFWLRGAHHAFAAQLAGTDWGSMNASFGRVSAAAAVADGRFELTIVLTVVLLLLVVWAFCLVLARRPHTRQWSAVLTVAAICLIAWFLFRGDAAVFGLIRHWLPVSAADRLDVVLWSCVGAALYLIVIGWLALRWAWGAPAEPTAPFEQGFGRGPAYTPFTKRAAGDPASPAIDEAGARADSVLPPDAE